MLKELFLFPISSIYGTGVRLRNFMYDAKLIKSIQFDIPIISIGNITVGGTGKTPHTEKLISFLKDEHKIAVLSRGYKRKTKGFILGTDDAACESIGDELMQIKQKFPDIIVAADEKRVRGVKKLRALHPEISLILLDDAFQHRKIMPGLSILLTDFNRPINEDHFLPLGRLRDSISQVRRAHVIIVTKAPADIKPIQMRVISQNLNILPYQTIFFTSTVYSDWKSVYPTNFSESEISKLKTNNPHILVVAGIANPERLLDYAKSVSKNVELIAFPDHHAFTPKDIGKIKSKFQSIQTEHKLVLTTEKDAVRFRCFVSPEVEFAQKLFYVPIHPAVINDTKNEFAEYIRNYIRSAQNDTKFYKAYNQNFGNTTEK